MFPGRHSGTFAAALLGAGLFLSGCDRAPAPPPPAAPVAAAAPRIAPAPVAVAAAPAAAPHAETTIDRLYAFLRDRGTWRPLTRQLSTDGSEEIRIGTWAVLTASGDRVALHVKNKSSAVETARLALELQSAGFAVDVAESGRR